MAKFIDLPEAVRLMRKNEIAAAVHGSRHGRLGVYITLRRKNTKHNPWAYTQLHIGCELPTGGGDFIQVSWGDLGPNVLVGQKVTDFSDYRDRHIDDGHGQGEVLKHVFTLSNGSEFVITEEHGNDEAQWTRTEEFFSWVKCEVFGEPMMAHDPGRRSPFGTPDFPVKFMRDLIDSGLSAEEAVTYVSQQIMSQARRFDNNDAKAMWTVQMLDK